MRIRTPSDSSIGIVGSLPGRLNEEISPAAISYAIATPFTFIVLLFRYEHLPDASTLTDQTIDSFDGSDGAGPRKGFEPVLASFHRIFA